MSASTTLGLDTDACLEEASRTTGLSDFGDLPFRDGLDTLLWALRNESGLGPEQAETAARNLVVPPLVKRLQLVEDRKAIPEIAEQEIQAPIVIVGLPRTGSTHLQALLASKLDARSPLEWEMRRPSPPPRTETFTTDPRIGAVQAAIDARANASALQAIHPYGAQRPEQCLGLIDWSFINQTFIAYHRIPTYTEWFLGADQRVLYAHHRRMLQHLQVHNSGSWVLKWPKHVFGLDALLETYPDARIVWTHRDPAKVVSSITSFVGTLRKMNSPVFDPKHFASEWVALEEMGLHRAIAVRDRVGDDRFVDIHYNDLIADPVAQVSRIYSHFEMPTDEKTIDRVRDFQDENPQNKHGKHSHEPEQFGLDRDQLRRRFASYTERFGVEPDRSRK